MTCGWDIELGRAAFSEAFSGYDANIYREDETWTREHHPPDVAEQMLTYEPYQSNDFLLDYGLQVLASRAPEPLSTQIRAVFAVRTRHKKLNAEAWCHDNQGRLIAVHAGTRTALMAFSLVHRRTIAFLNDLQSSENFQTTNNLIDAAQQQMSLLAADPTVRGVFDLRSRWSTQGHLGLEEEEIDWIRGNDEQVEDESAMSLHTELAEQFIIGHELAHHLLGHTWERAGVWGLCSHEAISVLETWRTKLALGAHSDFDSRSQELDADLFSFLLLSGALETDTPHLGLWYGAQLGSLLSFPVMELVLGPAEESPVGILGAYGGDDDYPSIDERIEQMVSVAEAFPGELPSDGSHSPEGIIIQMHLFRDLLVRFNTECGATSGCS